MNLSNLSNMRKFTPPCQTEYVVLQKIDRGVGPYKSHEVRKANWNMSAPPSLKGIGSQRWTGEVWVVKVMSMSRPRGARSKDVVEVMWHLTNLPVGKRADSGFKIAYARAQEIAQELMAGRYPDLAWPPGSARHAK